MPIRFVQQPPVEEAVVSVQRALAPDVVRIRYSFDDDWTGEPSIFFRILLSDAATRPGKRWEVAQRVTERLRDEVRSDEYGLHDYFNFRSESEQAELKDPAWA
jgi:hypothetical protein